MIMFYPKNQQELIPKNSSSKFRPSKSENPTKKSKNDENHNEFDKLNINVDDVKNMIENKFVQYDHLADSGSNFKHGHKFKLKSIDIKTNMPSYLSENVEKYKNWFDFDFENI